MNRVSPGMLLVFFFGTLMVLALAYGLKRSFENARPAPVAKEREKPTMVLLASTDLPAGRAISNSDFISIGLTKEQFGKRKWPALMMADGKQLLRRILRQPIKRGQPFEPDSFYPDGTGPDITERLGPDQRAITLELEVSGIPIQATPGNFVDVIFRSKPTKEESIPELTRTLLTGLEILAIGSNSTVGFRTPLNTKLKTQTVILAGTSDQAMRLKTTEGHGILSLTLRSEPEVVEPTSSTSLSNRSLTLAEVLDLPPEPEPEPPIEPPKPIVTEVYRRGKRSLLTFSPSGQSRQMATVAPSNPPQKPAPKKSRYVPPNADVDQDDIDQDKPATKDRRPRDPSMNPIEPAPNEETSDVGDEGVNSSEVSEESAADGIRVLDTEEEVDASAVEPPKPAPPTRKASPRFDSKRLSQSLQKTGS